MAQKRWYAGRFNGAEVADFGARMKNGAGYIAIGPVVILFDLPARHRKPNPVDTNDFFDETLAPAPQPNKNWRADRAAAADVEDRA